MPRNLLHQFRKARQLSFGVLAWLVLSLAAAVISPAMANAEAGWPSGQICSADGSIHDPSAGPEDSGAAHAVSAWHCVLCFNGAAPIALIQIAPSVDKPREVFQLASFSAPPPQRWAGPPPGRGPPTSL